MRYKRLRGEAAIGGGDDVFPADQLGEAHDALGDQFRMLDDVAGVRDHARTNHLAVGELYALEQMILVLVARIGGFETVRAGVDLEDIVDDVGERRLVEPRAFVDAVAGVEAHLLGRDALERGVGRLDIDLGAAPHLRAVEIRLEENIRQERIVDLHQNAGVGDGAVFLAELGGERVEILLVGFVVFVDADARRRGRRQEDVMVGTPRRRGRRL